MNATQFKQMRKKMGMSQVELAQSLGVSRVAVYYWEHGQRGIDKVLELAMSYVAEHMATATTKRRPQR